MEHKPFAVIAPVAVAAILILGILAGISSTVAAQLSKIVKSPYVSKTVKSPYVSKTVKSPYVSKTGATKTAYRAQGASNGKKRTELTISVTPTGPAKELNIPVKISGRLTSEGSGVAGATIRITSWVNICNGEDCTEIAPHDASTDSGGHYSVATTISGDKKSTYAINAMTKHIPSNYEDSKATTTIKLP